MVAVGRQNVDLAKIINMAQISHLVEITGYTSLISQPSLSPDGQRMDLNFAMVSFMDEFELHRPVDSLAQSILYLESLLKQGPHYEERWGMRQMIIKALGELYRKMIKQGQYVSLDVLERSLKEDSPDHEKNDDVQKTITDVLDSLSTNTTGQKTNEHELITNALGLLYPQMPEVDVGHLYVHMAEGGWRVSEKRAKDLQVLKE